MSLLHYYTFFRNRPHLRHSIASLPSIPFRANLDIPPEHTYAQVGRRNTDIPFRPAFSPSFPAASFSSHVRASHPPSRKSPMEAPRGLSAGLSIPCRYPNTSCVSIVVPRPVSVRPIAAPGQEGISRPGPGYNLRWAARWRRPTGRSSPGTIPPVGGRDR